MGSAAFILRSCIGALAWNPSPTSGPSSAQRPAPELLAVVWWMRCNCLVVVAVVMWWWCGGDGGVVVVEVVLMLAFVVSRFPWL